MICIFCVKHAFVSYISKIHSYTSKIHSLRIYQDKTHY
uniref:Uncharacterized protein n=1 Tax=Anguilla anguilla TaxID=7936 RepID=A0A0E9U8F1_ANGAN